MRIVLVYDCVAYYYHMYLCIVCCCAMSVYGACRMVMFYVCYV